MLGALKKKFKHKKEIVESKFHCKKTGTLEKSKHSDNQATDIVSLTVHECSSNDNGIERLDSGFGSSDGLNENNMTTKTELQPENTHNETIDKVGAEFDEEGGFLLMPHHGVSMFVPPGALAASKTLTMEVIEPHGTSENSRVMPLIEFGPEGTKFQCPVLVSIKVSDPASIKVETKQSDSDWTPVNDDVDDSALLAAKDVAVIAMTHFTRLRGLESCSDNGSMVAAACAMPAEEVGDECKPIQVHDKPRLRDGDEATTPVHVIVYGMRLNDYEHRLSLYMMRDNKAMEMLCNILKAAYVSATPKILTLNANSGDVIIQLAASGEKGKRLSLQAVLGQDYIGEDYVVDSTVNRHTFTLHQVDSEADKMEIAADLMDSTTHYEQLDKCKGTPHLPPKLRANMLKALEFPEMKDAFEVLLQDRGLTTEGIKKIQEMYRYEQVNQTSQYRHLLDLFEALLEPTAGCDRVQMIEKLKKAFGDYAHILKDIDCFLFPETQCVVAQPVEDTKVEVTSRKKLGDKDRHGVAGQDTDSAYVSGLPDDEFLMDPMKENYL